MRNLVLFILLSLVSGSSLLAQETQKVSCPNVILSSPARMVRGGAVIAYIVRIDNKDLANKLTYYWTVRSGKLVAGQGTVAAEVMVPEDGGVVVSVEIQGLPTGCPGTLSKALYIDRAPEASKLDEFEGPLSRLPEKRVTKIVNAINAAPNARIYFWISGDSKTEKNMIKQKKMIREQILSKLKTDRRPIFVEIDDRVERLVVWLVPAGAALPCP